MRPLLRHMLMILIAVFLTGSLATPHICLDDMSFAKTEQQNNVTKVAQDATDSHQNKSKTSDNCCVAHHCCFAKLVTPVQPMTTVAFFVKAPALPVTTDHFSSFDPKGLDRPPKSFA